MPRLMASRACSAVWCNAPVPLQAAHLSVAQSAFVSLMANPPAGRRFLAPSSSFANKLTNAINSRARSAYELVSARIALSCDCARKPHHEALLLVDIGWVGKIIEAQDRVGARQTPSA
jgi:hypothetical protein